MGIALPYRSPILVFRNRTPIRNIFELRVRGIV
jgi:hypothetical protein